MKNKWKKRRITFYVTKNLPKFYQIMWKWEENPKSKKKEKFLFCFVWFYDITNHNTHTHTIIIHTTHTNTYTCTTSVKNGMDSKYHKNYKGSIFKIPDERRNCTRPRPRAHNLRKLVCIYNFSVSVSVLVVVVLPCRSYLDQFFRWWYEKNEKVFM